MVERMLTAAQFGCELTTVNDAASLSVELAATPFDVVIANARLLNKNPEELTRVAALSPDTSMVLIVDPRSTAGEMEALSALATDCVFENQLQRLAPSVARATREAAERRERRQAEAALKVSEQRLQLALDAGEVTVWEYDLVSGEVRFSRQLGPMLGYTEAEVSPRIEAWIGLTHPDDLANVKAAMVRHFRGESASIDIEYRIRASDGDWRWLHTVGRVVDRDATGRATALTGTHRDVTERRQSDQQLRLLQLAMDAATNAILIADARKPDHPIVHVNRAFERMTGYTSAEVLGRNCRFLQGSDRDQPPLDHVRTALASGNEASVVVRNYRKDGTLFWNSLQVSPVRNGAGEVTHFVGIQSDVTELKNYQDQLEYRASHDALTGLLNRSALHDTVSRLIAHAKRAEKRFVVLYLDLDRFKVVNDSLGHASGDQLLICVADRLKACVRESDIVARLGGDEFAVVLADTPRAVSAASVAQKILHAIEQPVTILTHAVVTSTSIGACVYPDDGLDAESLLKNADSAMYRAKQSGRRRVCFYTDDLNRMANERLSLESALRRSLSRNEFELHYQPRVAIDSSRITSVEALVRWRQPPDELILPGRFIPLAEETGLIVPLGLWVLRTACMQMRQWRDDGYDALRMAVNVSARQLHEPDFVGTVGGILAECGLSPDHLELEITESVAMNDPEEMRGLLASLSDLGVSLSIDDFGTGQSSLAYLKRFPIDYLKIDQSFVQGICTDANDESIVRSIIALGKNLKLVVIAEGVETEEQRAFLEAAACDEMQGYLCSRPKPAHELAAQFAQAVRAEPTAVGSTPRVRTIDRGKA